MYVEEYLKREYLYVILVIRAVLDVFEEKTRNKVKKSEAYLRLSTCAIFWIS
jgi:hypothetical protein